MVVLRSRLSLLTGMGGAPSVTTRAGFSAMSREPSASALGDLRVTVRAFPPGQSPRTFHSSRSSCSVRLPGDSGVSPVRQGFYSPYFIVPKKGGGLRPILDHARLEPGPAQAPVQDADAQAHDQMHPAPGLVCSDRPEGCLLSCFDTSADRSILSQTVPTVCVRGWGMAVQGPPLRALPVPGGRPCPVTGSGHQDPQLSRAWPARENSYAITGTWCFGTSASWGFVSTGKRASSPLRRESLFLVWS